MPAIVLMTATQVALGIQSDHLREEALQDILEPVTTNTKPKLRLVG